MGHIFITSIDGLLTSGLHRASSQETDYSWEWTRDLDMAVKGYPWWKSFLMGCLKTKLCTFKMNLAFTETISSLYCTGNYFLHSPGGNRSKWSHFLFKNPESTCAHVREMAGRQGGISHCWKVYLNIKMYKNPKTPGATADQRMI